MRAGRLRWLVTIEHSPETQSRGELGGYESQWVPFAQVYAGIDPLSGRALEAAQARHGEVTAEVRIRYLEGVTDGMRVVDRGKVYAIQYVLNTKNQYREMVLGCSCGVSEGG